MSLTAARSVALVSGFNFVGWTGPELTPLAEAIAGLGTSVRSAFLWDPEAQEYLIYFRDAPAGLSTLAFRLPFSRPVWLFMDQAATWDQPARDGERHRQAGQAARPPRLQRQQRLTTRAPQPRPRSVAAGLRGPRPMA